jgi:hypothetical protein
MLLMLVGELNAKGHVKLTSDWRGKQPRILACFIDAWIVD